MIKGAGILFRRDGQLVLQRRDSKAPSSADKLSFFGGHLKPGEDPLVGLVREIHEETTIHPNELKYKFVGLFKIPTKGNHNKDEHDCYIYQATIHDHHFKVFEGKGAESYTLSELLKRDDLSTDTRYILNKLVKGA